MPALGSVHTRCRTHSRYFPPAARHCTCTDHSAEGGRRACTRRTPIMRTTRFRRIHHSRSMREDSHARMIKKTPCETTSPNLQCRMGPPTLAAVQARATVTLPEAECTPAPAKTILGCCVHSRHNTRHSRRRRHAPSPTMIQDHALCLMPVLGSVQGRCWAHSRHLFAHRKALHMHKQNTKGVQATTPVFHQPPQ